MPSALFKIRILLVAFVCSGFCGLNWSQLRNPPAETYLEQVIQKVFYEQDHLFASSQDEPTHGTTHMGRAELSTFGFGLSSYPLVMPPVLTTVGAVDQSQPESPNVQRDCMRNKDPPSFDGQILHFPSLALNHFEPSLHETTFLAYHSSRLRIYFYRLCALHEPGSGNRAGQTG